PTRTKENNKMRRTFTVIDIVEIVMHWYAGRSQAEVARSLGVDRGTVARYVGAAKAAGLVPGGPPIPEEDWRARVREWFPRLYDTRLVRPTWPEIARHHEAVKALVGVVPVSVIHQRLTDEVSLETSVASLRRYVRAHFPEEVRKGDVVVWRPPVEPGEEAQVDYGYMGTWTDPATGKAHRVWAFSMVLSYSRHLFVYPTLKMDAASWVAAHVAAFDFFGGCVARVVLDNLRNGVAKADYYDPKLNRAYAELGEYYRVLLDPARAFHPKDKPRIEAVQRYIRSSFFAGRNWPSMAAMVTDARRWSEVVAGRRTPRVLEGRTPLEVFGAVEAGALTALPAMPFELATWSTPKVSPDAHALVGRCLYSVPYRLIGRRLDARATPVKVELFDQGDLVKTHAFQAKGRKTDWIDLPEERIGFFMRTPVWCRAQAVIVGPATDVLVDELLALNVLYRLRQAQGVLRLAGRYGDARLEAACRRALEAGDPSYKTVKGILVAGTENDAVQQTLPGVDAPAWLRGPDAFGAETEDRP
ncbi:MAG: IS21 family transposase, partial [Streptosporangiaceae bacterium]